VLLAQRVRCCPEDDNVSGRYLAWRDLTFRVLPTPEEPPTIAVVVLSNCLKNHTFDGSKWKKSVVQLLSPNLAFRDFCRMFVILALYRGYFKRFETWAQLMSCRPSTHGSRSKFVDSCQDLAVIDSASADDYHYLPGQPMRQHTAQQLCDALTTLRGHGEKIGSKHGIPVKEVYHRLPTRSSRTGS